LIAHIATKLHADIGAGDVVEPSAVQGADLHVLWEFAEFAKAKRLLHLTKIFFSSLAAAQSIPAILGGV
jgi:hypothetical protein